MLSGNPDTFAIWWDLVEPWSSESFQNGCLGYFAGGRLMWSTNSTLGVDLSRLEKLYCINNSVEDGRLFKLPVAQAYKELCERTFPSLDSELESSDFRYLVSSESLSDEGHYFFLVEFSGQARLIYGFQEETSSVYETFLALGEFQRVVRNATSLSRSGPAK